jgi:hypothetical protein
MADHTEALAAFELIRDTFSEHVSMATETETNNLEVRVQLEKTEGEKLELKIASNIGVPTSEHMAKVVADVLLSVHSNICKEIMIITNVQV